MKKNKDKKLKAYKHLKRYIIAYQLQPGQRLEHEYLKRVIGVSTTPIREAMNQLTEEGYIYQIKNRGYFVSSLTAEELKNLYEIRQALEVFALKKTLTTGIAIPEKTINTLDRLAKKYIEFVAKEVFIQRPALDRVIHLALAKLAGNKDLVAELGGIFEKINYKRKLLGILPERGKAAATEHIQLLNYIRHNDIENALNALEIHINNGKEGVLKSLEIRDANLRGKRSIPPILLNP